MFATTHRRRRGRTRSGTPFVVMVVIAGFLLLALAPAALASTLSSSASFSDVPSGHKYFTAIEGMKASGAISGYPQTDGTTLFKPESNVWRAQFAKMICGALDLDVDESMKATLFNDLGEDKSDDLYPHQYVAAVAQHHITEGTSPGKFSPYVNITRAQVVTMIVRAANSLAPQALSTPPPGFKPTLGNFNKVHAPNMTIAEYSRLLDGLEGFGPDWDPWKDATRGEVAQMLWNLMQRKQSLFPTFNNIKPGVSEYDFTLGLNATISVASQQSNLHQAVTGHIRSEIVGVSEGVLTVKLTLSSVRLGDSEAKDYPTVTVRLNAQGEVLSVEGLEDLPEGLDSTTLRALITPLIQMFVEPFKGHLRVPGDTWSGESTLTLPEGGGNVTTQLSTRFESLEGAGADKTAVISYSLTVPLNNTLTIDVSSFVAMLADNSQGTQGAILKVKLVGTPILTGVLRLDTETALPRSLSGYLEGNVDIYLIEVPDGLIPGFDSDQLEGRILDVQLDCDYALQPAD